MRSGLASRCDLGVPLCRGAFTPSTRLVSIRRDPRGRVERPRCSAQVPVEITPFCHEHTLRKVAALPSLAGCEAKLRMGSAANNKADGDEIAVTDNGNYIVDLVFDKPIEDAPAAAAQLKNTCGVVDHGFFIGMTTAVIIAGEAGISVKTP